MTSRCSGLLPSASADVRSSDDVIAFEGLRFTGGQIFGGSVLAPFPITCVFPNTADGAPGSYIAGGVDNTPGTPHALFKMVEINAARDENSPGSVLFTTRAGYVVPSNDQCTNAAGLMRAWNLRNSLPAAGCSGKDEQCGGYGIIGAEVSVVTSTAPRPWNTYDISGAALPAGQEYAAMGADQKQTYYYNFCRGTRFHGSNKTSAGFRCDAGIAAVCETTENTISKGLAYPIGTLSNVKAFVTNNSVELLYSNPRTYDNGRNAVVTLVCDKYADEPVFFPVEEDPDKGPQYTLAARTKGGCSAKQMAMRLAKEEARAAGGIAAAAELEG